MTIHLYDRASWARALALTLDPELHAVLTKRFRRLDEQGLVDMTNAVAVTADTTEADLIEAIGWTPLVDPDGRRHDDPAFVQPFDYAYRASDRFYVAVQIVGNAGAAFELVVRDDAHPDMLALVREQAA